MSTIGDQWSNRWTGENPQDGKTLGSTVFVSDEDHPTILGADGEPLRLRAKRRIGFDLSRR